MPAHHLLQGIAHIRIFSLQADWERAAAFYRDLLKLPVRIWMRGSASPCSSAAATSRWGSSRLTLVQEPAE